MLDNIRAYDPRQSASHMAMALEGDELGGQAAQAYWTPRRLSTRGQPESRRDLPTTDSDARDTVFSFQLAMRRAQNTHRFPQPSNPPTAPNPPRDDDHLELQAALNIVEASLDELRSHIRHGNVSGPELHKVQQRLSERLPHVNARMEVHQSRDSSRRRSHHS